MISSGNAVDEGPPFPSDADERPFTEGKWRARVQDCHFWIDPIYKVWLFANFLPEGGQWLDLDMQRLLIFDLEQNAEQFRKLARYANKRARELEKAAVK